MATTISRVHGLLAGGEAWHRRAIRRESPCVLRIGEAAAEIRFSRSFRSSSLSSRVESEIREASIHHSTDQAKADSTAAAAATRRVASLARVFCINDACPTKSDRV